jgi:hypothetical protein
MRHWRQVTYKESADHIKAVCAEHFVLGTDLGQHGARAAGQAADGLSGPIRGGGGARCPRRSVRRLRQSNFEQHTRVEFVISLTTAKACG